MMNALRRRRIATGTVALAAILCWCVPAQAQRDASFVPPGAQVPDKDNRNAKHRDIVAADPGAIDTGETLVNITKRVTVFFSNIGSVAAKIQSLSLGADSDVSARLVDNDCEKLGSIPSNDRCAVTVEITPNTPGPWSAEVLLIHDQPGHVAEASISGNTLGENKKSDLPSGLAPLGKSSDEIDFGVVSPGAGTAARTVLLVNNSSSPLTIESIDLVEAQKGLSLLDSGCKVGLELASGGSCPITVLWGADGPYVVSTDLIVRHTGPVGFVVIPVRGTIGGMQADASAKSSSKNGEPPPNPDQALTDVTSKAIRLPAASLDMNSQSASDVLKLKGTVGQKAIINTSDGRILIVGTGEAIEIDGASYKILSVSPESVEVRGDSGVTDLVLENPSESDAKKADSASKSAKPDSGLPKPGGGGISGGGLPGLGVLPTISGSKGF